MGLGVKSLALAVAFATPVAARTPRRHVVEARVPVAPHVVGVQREHVLELPAGSASAAFAVRALPGALGFEIELAVPPAQVAQALDALDEPWHVQVRRLEGGVQIRVAHPQPGVLFTAARIGDHIRIAFGAADEQTRLRAFATTVRMPLPEPEDLGAELEVWQEAERSIGNGDLPQAKRLWERLADVPRLADLAALRVAELYIASGHINEALAQLRGVSSRHPRSAGAALARLDVLHLEAITGLGTPTAMQIDVAAAVVDRAGFDVFARVRAAMVLREMGATQAALARLPDPASLPPSWRGTAETLRQDLLALTLVGPMLRGDLRATAIHWALWSARLGSLAEHDAVTDMVAQAHEQLGLFEDALPLLQARLRTEPPAAVEADLVGRVAHAYRMLGDADRASFAIEFQLGAHPEAPGIVDEVGALAITRCVRDGLPAARAWLGDARKRAGSASTSQAIDALEDELVLGWGTPAQIVHSLSPEMESSPNKAAIAPAPTGDAATPTPHVHALGVALVRAGRHAQAAELLRTLAGRTADPNERDRLAYHLGVAEQGLGRTADAQRIFAHISTHGTTFGQLAVVQLQERRLAAAVASLATSTGGEAP